MLEPQATMPIFLPASRSLRGPAMAAAVAEQAGKNLKIVEVAVDPEK